uniref:V-type proton ATPase subunit a n=1 Tax=Setaria digitata TaxID=48799 RepID=A0A915PWN9_9BILA
MGSLYRSEQMRFCQMIIQKDAAFSCVAELGKQPYVQFKDLNAGVNPFQRMYLRDIQRFEELERKLRFLDAQIRKDDIEVNDDVDGDDTYEILAPHQLNELEGTLIDLERDVINMNESNILLKRNYLELKEWEAILEKTDHFFEEGISDVAMHEIEAVQEESAFVLKSGKEPIGFLAGVINRDRVNAFEKVLWRACHKTAFVRTTEIEEELENPDSGETCLKSVFVIFYKGDRLRIIIEKVCEGFKAKLYSNCSKNSKDRHSAARDVKARISDMRTVLGQTQEHRHKVLQAASNSVRLWQKEVRMQKSVYYTLNLFTFDAIGKFFIAECWVPYADLENVRVALEKGVRKSGSSVRPVLNLLETTEEPPTYNRVNKFTRVFQAIVDSYGIASYLEINPAPYTIITFPFIFACMFGDLGHGIIMLLAGLWMVLREKNLAARKIKDEIFNMFFGGRYIILLMGIFSVHAGFLYNDLFAKSFNLFGSKWRNPFTYEEIESWDNQSIRMNKEIMIDLPPSQSYMHDSGPYWFGVDPIWNMAENRLNFLNSLKMKLSVILGITHMTFGVFLSLLNYIYFKSKIEICTVFIPQILFMFCIFVYLCAQIIIKWLFFWVREEYIFGLLYPGSHCAPSLLIGLINMFMFKHRPPGFVDESEVIARNNNHVTFAEWPNCYLGEWYPRQLTVEADLVVIAVICVPIMLFGKPIYFLLRRKKRNAVSDNAVVWMNQESEKAEITLSENGSGLNKKMWEETASDSEYEGESFGDVMVHQAIHTIEYVLGSVSHTASYLRLWALSLAHARLASRRNTGADLFHNFWNRTSYFTELSEVLWEMVLVQAFSISGIVGYIATYLIFFAFGILTVSILVLMEGLSAFLHALRLHWVEFQSKFYLGLGYPFVPFYFKDVLMKANTGEK